MKEKVLVPIQFKGCIEYRLMTREEWEKWRKRR